MENVSKKPTKQQQKPISENLFYMAADGNISDIVC